MGHRNHNLSYIANGTVHKGRALKLNSDGTVSEITALSEAIIIGWSLEDRESGQPVSIRMMTEGTIECEVASSITGYIYAGQEIYLTDIGTVTNYTTAAGVDENGYKDRYGFSLGYSTGATSTKYIEVLMLRQYPLRDRAYTP